MKRVLESIRYLAFYQRLDFAFEILFNENQIVFFFFWFSEEFRRNSETDAILKTGFGSGLLLELCVQIHVLCLTRSINLECEQDFHNNVVSIWDTGIKPEISA